MLSNLEGTFHAIGEECTHEGGLLSEGYVEGTEVECPNHGSLFDLKTGENTGPPVTENVPRYSVRVEGDDVLGWPVWVVDRPKALPLGRRAGLKPAPTVFVLKSPSRCLPASLVAPQENVQAGREPEPCSTHASVTHRPRS